MAASSFNIDTFTAKLTRGGALTSLFECEIQAQGKGTKGNITDFTFLCKGVSLPASNIDQATITYMGRCINIPSNRAAVQWTTTIYNDEFMATRNHIENWMEQLNSHKTNKRATGMQRILDYTGTLEVAQLQKTDSSSETKTYEFMNAWPSAVGEITVDWETNEILTYDVTWEYAYWRSADSAVGM